MYEMPAGEPPFKGDQTTLMNKHLNEKPPPFRVKQKFKTPKILKTLCLNA